MSLIDVHAHFLPPGYRDALARAGIDQPDGFLRVPMWSAEDHVAVMDRVGIDVAMLSVSSPPFDTTRAVTNLLLSGTLTRHPDIRWIVPHAGGTLPFPAPADCRHQRAVGRRRSGERRRLDRCSARLVSAPRPVAPAIGQSPRSRRPPQL